MSRHDHDENNAEVAITPVTVKVTCQNVTKHANGNIDAQFTPIIEEPEKSGDPSVRINGNLQLHTLNVENPQMYVPGQEYTLTIS